MLAARRAAAHGVIGGGGSLLKLARGSSICQTPANFGMKLESVRPSGKITRCSSIDGEPFRAG